MNSQFGHERDGACTQIQPIDVFYQKGNLKITIQSRLCIFAVGNPAMADQTASGETGNRTEVANYVATLSADFATMARRSGLDTLGYLLEMVRLEAESETRHRQNGGR